MFIWQLHHFRGRHLLPAWWRLSERHMSHVAAVSLDRLPSRQASSRGQRIPRRRTDRLRVRVLIAGRPCPVGGGRPDQVVRLRTVGTQFVQFEHQPDLRD